MKEDVRIANSKDIPIALVDQYIEITLKRLSKAITWKEKKNFLADMLKALFLRKSEIGFDLETVPDKKIIRKIAKKLKERYPNIFRVLIDERNVVIAENLRKLMEPSDRKILVILGAGHVDDVVELVKESNAKISYSFSLG